MTKSEWPKRLSKFGWAIAIFAIGVCVIVLICPDSEFARRVAKFKTLLTGMTAGLGALVSAWIVYGAAKLPIDAKKQERKDHESAMRTAGAVVINNAITTIFMSLMHEAGKPDDRRGGALIVPNALPNLEVISTQENDIIEELSLFIRLASSLEATEDPKFQAEGTVKLKKMWLGLTEKLETVAGGGAS